MGNDKNNNEEINTTSLHNLCFFIIIVLICAVLYFTVHTYIQTRDQVNTGSLEHYDTLYSTRQSHISIDQSGNITGYNAPDGTHYTFDTPIPSDIFYNTVN